MEKEEKTEKKTNKKDIIIKVILIIIIILLLIHNCVMIRKKGESSKPNGNVNVIEIKCDENNICKKKKDKDKNVESEEQSNTNNSSSNSNNSSANNNSSNGNNPNGGSSPNAESTNQESEEIIDDEDGNVLVKDNTVKWSQNTDLKIFSNSYYNFEDKIAPETSNTYKFIVKNSTDMNLKYNIKFSETNPYNINMKYRLKKNNTYITNNYVTFSNLDLSNLLLNSKKEDTYYLDWKWFSSDNDTAAGENGANYKLNILVEAESY